MKVTLTAMKNNLQRISSRVDELRIKSLIWNIRKQKTEQQKKKK